MNQAEFRAVSRAYRALRKADAQWLPDPYADRRGKRERWPNHAQRYLSAQDVRLQQCLTGYPVRPTERQARIELCKRFQPHERSKEAAIAHGKRLMRESKAAWLRMNQEMPSLAEGPCRLCESGNPCAFHRQSRLAA